jgi:DNA mismatch repair protein MutL
VDVNIHPAKREVKFHREFEIRKFVAQAVQETLLAFHGQQSAVQSPKSKVTGQAELRPAPEISAPALPNFPEKLKPSPAIEPPKSLGKQPPLRMGFAPSEPVAGEPQSQVANQNPEISQSAPEPNPQSAIRNPQSATPLLNVPLRLVGVIGKLYAVLESDRGLVLLDQHAAHERILFEQMLNRLEQNGTAPSQKLLLPETIELPARDANFLREQLISLTRLGVGLSEFGERTFLLDALPPFVKTADARRFVLDLVDELKAAGREVNLARLGEHTIAKTVCRHAVKANDPLAGAELEALVEDLRRCAMPYTCPHGRPTLIEMNYRELEKKFGRTQ